MILSDTSTSGAEQRASRHEFRFRGDRKYENAQGCIECFKLIWHSKGSIMKTRSLINILSSAAIIFSVALSGCIALKTFPQAARAGDTVSLAVGSADGMTRANTTATFVSDSAPNTPINLTPGIRGIFRLYADKASGMFSDSAISYVVDTSGHEPWVTVMVVDLPPGLPTGTGKVHITTTAAFPTIDSSINDVPINLEILPGTGAPSNLPYEFGVGSSRNGDLTQLETAPHALVMPVFPQSTAWPTYGAIELKLHVPTTAGTALGAPFLRVLVDDMGAASTSSSLNAVFRHDSNQNLTLMLLSPTGKLRYYEARFSIVPLNNQTQSISFTTIPVITSVRYFDINGNQVAGPLVSDYVVQLR